MTLEKIKHYMDPIIFNYWKSNLPNQDDINKAYKDLKKEIEIGLLKDVKYHAELNLLKSKINF